MSKILTVSPTVEAANPKAITAAYEAFAEFEDQFPEVSTFAYIILEEFKFHRLMGYFGRSRHHEGGAEVWILVGLEYEGECPAGYGSKPTGPGFKAQPIGHSLTIRDVRWKGITLPVTQYDYGEDHYRTPREEVSE